MNNFLEWVGRIALGCLVLFVIFVVFWLTMFSIFQ